MEKTVNCDPRSQEELLLDNFILYTGSQRKYFQMTENAIEGNMHKRKKHTNMSYFILKGTTGQTHTDLSYFHRAMKIKSEKTHQAPSPIPYSWGESELAVTKLQ